MTKVRSCSGSQKPCRANNTNVATPSSPSLEEVTTTFGLNEVPTPYIPELGTPLTTCGHVSEVLNSRDAVQLQHVLHDGEKTTNVEHVETIQLQDAVSPASGNDDDNDFLFRVSWRPRTCPTGRFGNPEDLYS
ncbi:unnamed protein product [Orchesella dallaii]|uniref:Uncharacterized protein n=1 Tax=Orchesella dallaii TaxID=48710 RepID=A0ABP1QZL7_9HEXA